MSAVATSSGATNLKRLRTPSSDEDGEYIKRPKMPPRYYYILAPESSDVESSAESVYSIQGHTTDLAKDTSDTSTSSDSVIEFDVVSLSEGPVYPFPSKDSSSSPEDVIRQTFGHTIKGPSESETSERSSIALENAKDWSRFYLFTNCILCGNQNPTPLYRYCFNCYKVRKNFFPPRPKIKKKSTLDQQSSGNQDSGVSLESIESLPAVISAGISKINPDEPLEKKEMCGTCLVNPKDGGYVHKNIVHIYSCYRCSKRILKTIGRCPICNTRVSQVCKVITI